MMRALFAGVSGLRNHQTWMDVIGNNIANVNTVAFKASRVTFKEAFAQLVQGAAQPTASVGGTNPIQIGAGVNLGSIDQLFTQGSLQSTGQNTDLAIQGDGFFIVNNGSRDVYTRAGNFQLDATGRLVTPAGFVAQGQIADAVGNFPSGGQLGDVQIDMGATAPARETTQMAFSGNLDASAQVDDVHTMGITVYDATGAPHDLQVEFVNTGPGTWEWTVTSAGAVVAPPGAGTVSFNGDGTLATFTYPGGASDLTLTPTSGAANPFQVTIDAGTVGDIDGLTGFAGVSDSVVNSQDGYQAGNLVEITVDYRGIITGFFTNGTSRNLAQIALANFDNPSGLLRTGDNVYTESANSGIAIVNYAGETSSSSITPGALESSNVDISQEFTNMIIAQRGFQANARVISTADEMLRELVNIRR
jgi:flagellar hook protein FlgE